MSQQGGDIGLALMGVAEDLLLDANLPDRIADKEKLTISIEDNQLEFEADNSAPNTGEYFQIFVECGDKKEHFPYVTMDDVSSESEPKHFEYVGRVLEKSKLISAEDIYSDQKSRPLTRRPANGTYEIRKPLHSMEPETVEAHVYGSQDDRQGIHGLFEIDEVSMIAFPDLMKLYEGDKKSAEPFLDLEQIHGIMEVMISRCETSFPSPPHRMVVLDPPPVKLRLGRGSVAPEEQKPQDVAQWLKDFNRRSMFAALYYPWIKVPNPNKAGKPLLVPPCGHMMGIWCRTDQNRGIYKAPANETPRGVTGLAYETNIREQELLNPEGINCIRNFSNYSRGYKIWGARTLVEPDNIQWRYISVRRLISYIEKSIERGTQWVVFEPNDEDLWARVTRTVEGFLAGLWRDGALFGSSPADAFYVKCDGDLNTHDTMMKGRLYIEVGVSPVRPAEFVIFRLSQWAPNQ
ncbi:phage tail sheath family protein [filamentous cyanobacterium LEGE 11480]|uniref:Phage tail sheath family protein n=2 Tax=Romeriopsis TaxID=2992131 RepID=A0A928VRZ7_9CYAN|nr:phage tail sheath family protein [Romeriopsis navalis LEGE 11480]